MNTDTSAIDTPDYDRRTFLKTGLVALAATAAPSLPGATENARKRAIRRPRRVIFNNDGDDAFATDAPATKEGFLSVRMDHIAGCGIDTVFYCTSISSVYSYDSKVLEVATSTSGPQKHNRVPALLRLGTDPLRLAIESCRKNGREVFWTLRMNDIHDNWLQEIRARWKDQHRDWVMGTPEEAARYGMRDPRAIWTLADYERPEVRAMMVRAVAEVLENYDIDGVDLDFLRHICYFKETRLGQPVTPAHRRLLTDMVSQIRRLVLAASERQGRPLLLSARVLPTLALNREYGLDLEAWVDRGYLDFIAVGAGFDPFTSPGKPLVDWCHRRDMPAYGCITSEAFSQGNWSGPPLPGSELSEQSRKSWLGAASNTWAQGVDGIMTFNLSPDREGTELSRSVWRDIGDPAKLATLDKLYAIEHLHDDDYCFMFRSVSRQGRLPLTIDKEGSGSRVLVVADDIPNQAGRIRSLRLRLYLDRLQEPDRVAVRLNGVKLAMTSDQPQWLAVEVPPRIMRKGPNELAISFGQFHEKSASWALALRSVELNVAYAKT